nr:MAG TPA: hypothetical protein [Caudoviricetes sp.]
MKRAHSSKGFVICSQSETYFLLSGGVGNGFPAHLLRSPLSSPSRSTKIIYCTSKRYKKLCGKFALCRKIYLSL